MSVSWIMHGMDIGKNVIKIRLECDFSVKQKTWYKGGRELPERFPRKPERDCFLAQSAPL